jgi:Cdc6-like AAA superfamily ATPase
MLQSKVGTSVVAKSALEFIAKKSAKANNGDARYALELLVKVIRYVMTIAEPHIEFKEGPLVLPKDVHACTINTISKEKLATLPEISRITLCVLCRLTQDSSSDHCWTLRQLKDHVEIFIREYEIVGESAQSSDFKLLAEIMDDNGFIKMKSKRKNEANESRITVQLNVSREDMIKTLQKDFSQSYYQKLQAKNY